MAARRLIESQLGTVVRIASKYLSSEMKVLDLLQEGNVGLMEAVRTFSTSGNGDFKGYAATCIDEALAKAVARSRT